MFLNHLISVHPHQPVPPLPLQPLTTDACDGFLEHLAMSQGLVLSKPRVELDLDNPTRHGESRWCCSHLWEAVQKGAFSYSAEIKRRFVPLPKAELTRCVSQGVQKSRFQSGHWPVGRGFGITPPMLHERLGYPVIGPVEHFRAPHAVKG